jgi:predicted O-linked N-acetylglucosamine transferase (SPINDLY family)
MLSPNSSLKIDMQILPATHLSPNSLSELADWDSCWQAGINLVLLGEIDEAQATWLLPFLNADSSVIEMAMNNNLAQALEVAAIQQCNTVNFAGAVDLRQLLRGISPNNLNNLLQLIVILPADEYHIGLLQAWSILELLQNATIDSNEIEILGLAMKKVLENFKASEIEQIEVFLTICLQKTPDHYTTLSVIVYQSFVLTHKYFRSTCAVRIFEVCLANSPPKFHINILRFLADSAAKSDQYDKAIQAAQSCCQISHNSSADEQVNANYQLLSVLMEAGHWEEIPTIAQTQIDLLASFIQESPTNLLDSGTTIISSYFLNYLYDQPRQLHSLRNGTGQIYSNSMQPLVIIDHTCVGVPKKDGILRIGYIASTLRQHSVGWLSRWLFAHHNQQQFDIFIYHINQQNDDPFNHHYFRDRAHIAYYFDTDLSAIVQQIQKDEIDILVDLDSLAFTATYEVMCRKPAPVQVTWLGWDASGCPAIDYYIADPYVLPTDADGYYSAKIWRLPHTYLAIDGFESIVPTRKRADYNLPSDAIVYLCNQKSYKHHPDILRLQMQIIKAVPNSYLLVKLRSSQRFLVESYQILAKDVGVDMERLRFLEPDPQEVGSRANLTLADVVLDTFPYNGATTTLETLWMNIPMVTKVGQAFVARNSYTFMLNAGITEGIAWTDTEYVDWGIRLGVDHELRQQVRGKLLTSRKTSPLWNAQQFTKDMESAYQSMWQKHLEQQN